MGDNNLYALDPLLNPRYEDMLHVSSSFVEHFYRLITASVKPPFAISIDGLWGTGKTTVMQLLQSKLQGRDGGYPVFWFNPWEYQVQVGHHCNVSILQLPDEVLLLLCCECHEMHCSYASERLAITISRGGHVFLNMYGMSND
jgi:thymidylate kinase